MQSAVLLHMVTHQWPEIPVVMVDTRYLFPETYRFADALTERLKLNLKVYRAQVSAAWLEARHGKMWEHGLEGIERYNQINKVEPMQRAIASWRQGLDHRLRRQQSKSRKEVGVLQLQNGIVKVQPIIDWTDRMVWEYLKKHDLPYHPLWEQGYVSVGDVHTTRPADSGHEQRGADALFRPQARVRSAHRREYLRQYLVLHEPIARPWFDNHRTKRTLSLVRKEEKSLVTHVTESTYQQEVESHPGRVLIDFYTPTCPPCRAFAPTLDQIAAEQAGTLKVVKIDASEEPNLATEFGVRAVPTFVLLERGTRKAQIVGARSKKAFEQWLAEN